MGSVSGPSYKWVKFSKEIQCREHYSLVNFGGHIIVAEDRDRVDLLVNCDLFAVAQEENLNEAFSQY